METSRLIVQLKGEMALERVAELSALVEDGRVERVSRRGRVLLRVPDGTDVQTVLRALNELPYVDYAEADVTDYAQDEV